MNDKTIIQQQLEKVKLIRGASGKYGYEISLLGKPEDNLVRIKELKIDFDNLIEFNNYNGGDKKNGWSRF